MSVAISTALTLVITRNCLNYYCLAGSYGRLWEERIRFQKNEPKKLLKTKGEPEKRTENEAKVKSANLLKINEWPKIEKKRTDNKPEKANLENLGLHMVQCAPKRRFLSRQNRPAGFEFFYSAYQLDLLGSCVTIGLLVQIRVVRKKEVTGFLPGSSSRAFESLTSRLNLTRKSLVLPEVKTLFYRFAYCVLFLLRRLDLIYGSNV